MIAKNVTKDELYLAMDKVNELFENNITWNREPEKIGKRFQFTLYTKSVEKPGHRLGLPSPTYDAIYKPRRLRSACWHVHGEFFDALFDINPDAVIRSNGKVVDIDNGNWIDWNAGSQMYPVYMSELCEC